MDVVDIPAAPPRSSPKRPVTIPLDIVDKGCTIDGEVQRKPSDQRNRAVRNVPIYEDEKARIVNVAHMTDLVDNLAPREKTPEKKILALSPGKRRAQSSVVLVQEGEPGTCPCINSSKTRAGKPPVICGRKIKANGRCGYHQVTCKEPEVLVAAVQRAPIQVTEPVEAKRRITPPPPRAPVQVMRAATVVDRGGLCPCLNKTKSKPGQPPVFCANRIKANGRCGIHQNTCLEPKVEVRQVDIPPNVPAPPIDILPLARSSPRRQSPVRAVTEVVRPAVNEGGEKREGCPCILTSKTRAGQPPVICGRRIVENGHCGIHRKNCVLPLDLTEERKSILVEEKQPRALEVTRRVGRVTVDQARAIVNTCPCLIYPKGGAPPRPCGKRVKQDGRCGVHLKGKCALTAAAVEEREKVELAAGLCPCIIKRTRLPCGNKLKPGMDRCGQHKKTCTRIVAEAEVLEDEEPVVRVSPPKPARVEEKELWQELEEAFEEEEPVEIKQDELEKVAVPQEDEVAEDQDIIERWTEIQVANAADVEAYMRQLDIQPSVNLEELLLIENKIQECLMLA